MTDLPLSPLDFSVLLVLSEGPNYGYGLVKAIGAGSAGSIRLAPGNLYQVLDRLLVREWIRELAKREVAEAVEAAGGAGGAGGRRRYYAITAAGRAAARAEASRLRAMLPTLERLELLGEGA